MYSIGKTFRHILVATTAALLGVSCSVYDSDNCLGDGSSSKVVLDIVVPSAARTKALTKAEDGPWSSDYTYEDGDTYDNYIDLNTLQILFYSTGTDGTAFEYTAALTDYDIIPISREDDDNYETNYAYRVLGAMTTKEGTTPAPGNYKVVVLANCPTVENPSKLSELKVTDFFNGKKYIPMWGMATQDFKFENGEVDDIGKISLLRATAKLEVALALNEKFNNSYSEDLSKIQLKSVKLLRGVIDVNCTPNVAFTTKDVTNTEQAMQERCFNPTGTLSASSPFPKDFAPSTDKKKASVVVPEFTTKPSTSTGSDTSEEEGTDATAPADKAVIEIVIVEEADTENERELTFYMDPIANNKETPDGPGAFVRNHLYRFNIVYYNGGKLYVKPTVSDWVSGTEITYTINMSTSMRLFDSWLYRYDTDGKDYLAPQDPNKPEEKKKWENWATSHMAVSTGVFEDVNAEAGNIEKLRPIRSPQIQLRTTGDATGSFTLKLDNTNFQLVKAVKGDTGVVTSYDSDDKIEIPGGENVTYFYIVPKTGTDITWTESRDEDGKIVSTNKEAKVTLLYNDPTTGIQKVPFNYNSLPGYSDDSSEIWVWYVEPDDYKNPEVGGKRKYLKMFFQDYNNPLVPTADQS